MKGLLRLIGLALPIFLFAFFAGNSYAANTSYLITNSQEIGPPGVRGVGQILYYRLFSVNYKPGKWILSSDPEGTQSAAVGDSLIINTSYPHIRNAIYKLYSPDCKTISLLPPTDLTDFISPLNNGINNFTFRYADWCGGKKQISSLYLVNIQDEPSPSPTPTPSPSPTPTPTPTPFLDLPWDYEGKGLTFNEAAQSINAYFDHEYPLLSTGLSEPEGTRNSIISFMGGNPNFDQDYSKHDGYDYGKSAKANIGDPVLAAANGCATYSSSTTGGNVIRVDHDNGYQTKYLHLQKDGLVTESTSVCTDVIKGQQIGLVGYSGNVRPKGENGAHIHFMVVQDKDGDGNFEDNIPDGITDPFGWQSKEQDPWPEFSWKVGEATKTGNVSYYLWTKPIANLSDQLTANGGYFQVERYKLNFPQGATQDNLNLQMNSSPMVRVSDILKSIGSTILITAKNVAGYEIKSFFQPFTINIDFSGFDTSLFKPETVSIYSSEDGITWTKEPTIVDFTEKTASANINHLSYFALMGERADTTAPTTTTIFTGDMGQAGWFRSDVQLALDAKDNEGGLGVDYTLYKIGDEDWTEYTAPFNFTDEGSYKVEFYSADNDENIEEVKIITFNIDKTTPEANIFIDPNLPDLVVKGIDPNQTSVEKLENTETEKESDNIYVISDLAGNTIKLDVRDKDQENKDKFRIFAISYNDDLPIELDKNLYKVKYKEDLAQKYMLEESFSVKGEVKISIDYDQNKNKSTLVSNFDGQDKIKEIIPGLVLLQLVTNQGNLEYSNQ